MKIDQLSAKDWPTGLLESVALSKKSKTVSVTEILTSLENRIKLLKTIQAAVLVAFGAEVEPAEGLVERKTWSRQPKVKAVAKTRRMARKPRADAHKSKAKGSAQIPVMEILQAAPSPLGTDEILKRLQLRNWQTTATRPRDTVYMTLKHMIAKGLVRKVGNDFEAVPQASDAPASWAEAAAAGI